MEREALPARAAATGAYRHTGLNDLRRHPSMGDVRGIGMMWGIEFVRNRETKERSGNDSTFIRTVRRECEAAGPLTRVQDVLQLAPPLVTRRETIDRITATLDRAITVAEREVGLTA